MYLKISANNTATPANDTTKIESAQHDLGHGQEAARELAECRQGSADHQRDQEEKADGQDHAERKEALFDGAPYSALTLGFNVPHLI